MRSRSRRRSRFRRRSLRKRSLRKRKRSRRRSRVRFRDRTDEKKDPERKRDPRYDHRPSYKKRHPGGDGFAKGRYRVPFGAPPTYTRVRLSQNALAYVFKHVPRKNIHKKKWAEKIGKAVWRKGIFYPLHGTKDMSKEEKREFIEMLKQNSPQDTMIVEVVGTRGTTKGILVSPRTRAIQTLQAAIRARSARKKSRKT